MTANNGGGAQDRWTRRIRGLLANAADPALTDDARQAYQAKAAELMTRHGIEQAQLHTDGVGGPALEAAQVWSYAVSAVAGLGQARARAASRIAEAMGCKALYHNNPHPGTPVTVMVTGVVADIAALKTLLPLVVEQADLAAAGAAAGGRRAHTWLASFLVGYGTHVAERIEKRRGVLVAEGGGAELVLASRQRIVQTHYQDTFGHVVITTASNRDRADGLAAGWAAGSRADLGGACIDQTR
ncbi:MAG: DUF2786 domain-containing protein [Natronosporangium sp.]